MDKTREKVSLTADEMDAIEAACREVLQYGWASLDHDFYDDNLFLSVIRKLGRCTSASWIEEVHPGKAL